jgi:hypothetical protein
MSEISAFKRWTVGLFRASNSHLAKQRQTSSCKRVWPGRPATVIWSIRSVSGSTNMINEGHVLVPFRKSARPIISAQYYVISALY